ncbi:auxin-responsive protein IAA13-like isoform X2 [Coffea eugenioides]|nr:auxin-responsive protein IAA13-like isoform X2 [Coffea arabica]XP_027118905.1 auxin-responsive protein IAA13-like isoform X2 [Coffea arabica]XP_027165247.1 auxin-responsive protein IAA13-like isoform X2 [Coffea eugenioides]
MEQTLGLLGGGCGGGGSGGGPGGSSGGSGGSGLSNETASSAVSKVEKDYMGLSSEGSSYENEEEIELGLGLSLSSGGGTGGVGKNKGSLWGDYGRILTAKDLPNGFSGRAGGVSGTKRAADCVSPAENVPASTGVSQVVGWPPIRAFRMNSLVNQSKNPNVEEDKGVGGNEKKENLKKKTNYGNHKTDDTPKDKGHLGYIKVNMDGVPIGRKVDLNAHNCYESLAEALEEMFFNTIAISGEKESSRQPPKLLDESSEFVLTYEDKEGDWMLVGDVPWGMFLCTVKRLRIMRNSEANGIAPTIQQRHERLKGKPI